MKVLYPIGVSLRMSYSELHKEGSKFKWVKLKNAVRYGAPFVSKYLDGSKPRIKATQNENANADIYWWYIHYVNIFRFVLYLVVILLKLCKSGAYTRHGYGFILDILRKLIKLRFVFS